MTQAQKKPPLPANNHVTYQFLEENPQAIFVFGDNLLRKGTGGAAALRHHVQSLGFVTKKSPTHADYAYYRPEEYKEVYAKEIENLKHMISNNPGKTFYISMLGAGLANKFGIFEMVIRPNLKIDLRDYPNVVHLW